MYVPCRNPSTAHTCNDAGKTRDPDLAWSHSEAYGSAWENRNLRSIDTYRSCTQGLQKTAYLHLGDCNVKYTKAMKGRAGTESAEDRLGSGSTLVRSWYSCNEEVLVGN
jgi:hypothetical protein